MPKTMGLLGKKIGMTRLYNEIGAVIPVTVIEAGPCKVLQVKSETTDGYSAIQVGFETKKPQRVNKALAGHFKKSDSDGYYNIREFRVQNSDDYQTGQEITLSDLFKTGDVIDVQGTSQGKGFQGVMKRHNFHGFKASHGVHESYRGPGSIGQCATPARVFKGKKLPGHQGVDKVSVLNLKVVKVDVEKNLVMVKGAIPGHRNSIVRLRKEL